ncbi:hypothetical protein [Catenulispora sp. EB89]|uniref:hypothetical protein n=1 Tax=Catenulispora sp. EB89 TaxID=3156257 RepID=UPI003510FD9D
MVGPQLLDGDITSQDLVAGPPDDAHGAAADLGDQAVAAGDEGGGGGAGGGDRGFGFEFELGFRFRFRFRFELDKLRLFEVKRLRR